MQNGFIISQNDGEFISSDQKIANKKLKKTSDSWKPTLLSQTMATLLKNRRTRITTT